MKPGGGRNKGNSFERHIAKLIVETFACYGITKKDCYRTPGSGGHRYACQSDPGDHVFSPELSKYFPFCTECKSYKKLDWPGLLSQKKSGQFVTWWRQVKKAAEKTGAQPLLIFKQNHSEPYCLLEEMDDKNHRKHLYPLLFTKLDGDYVIVAPFKSLLRYYQLLWAAQKDSPSPKP